MPSPRKLETEDALRYHKLNMSYAEIAEMHNMTVSGVQQVFRKLGLSRKNPSHRDVRPWTIAKQHQRAMPAQYLRMLSRLIQGLKLDESDLGHEEKANTAIKWANRLLDQELDVDYDREKPPSDFCPQGGFFTKKADPENYHLSKVMGRVRAVMTRNI
jgi:hypothetical protein